MYTGIKIWENGTREECTFEDYSDLCTWLAESPEAGMAAYHDGEAIAQTQIQVDAGQMA